MKKEMKFQRLKFEHLPQMVEIEKEAFSSPWTINMFIPELASENSVYLVGIIDDEVVCYGGFKKILDEGHIMNIAVKTKHRNLGYGKQLLSALFNWARLLMIKSLTLEVRVNNQAAIKLYTSFGFKNAGLRKNYYPDNTDAVIMWAEL